MAQTDRGLVSQIFIHGKEEVFTTTLYWQMTSGENPFLGPANLAEQIGIALAADALPAFGTDTTIEAVKVWPEGFAFGYSWMESFHFSGTGGGVAVEDLRHVRLSLISELVGTDRIVNRNQISGCDATQITDGRVLAPITDALSAFILEAASNGLVGGGITFNLGCRRANVDEFGVFNGTYDYRALSRWQFNPFVGTRKDRCKREMGKRKPVVAAPP